MTDILTIEIKNKNVYTKPLFADKKKILIFAPESAGVAQLVEHNLAKVRVAGSSPVSRSNFRGIAASSSIMCYSVYVIYSESSDSYYKGQTGNLHDRIARHNKGREKSTCHGVPWRLVWCAQKPDRASAMRLEKKLKNLSREKLEYFIRKNSDDPTF